MTMTTMLERGTSPGSRAVGEGGQCTASQPFIILYNPLGVGARHTPSACIVHTSGLTLTKRPQMDEWIVGDVRKT